MVIAAMMLDQTDQSIMYSTRSTIIIISSITSMTNIIIIITIIVVAITNAFSACEIDIAT